MLQKLIQRHNSWVFPETLENLPGWFLLAVISFLAFMFSGLVHMVFHDVTLWVFFNTTDAETPVFIRVVLYLSWLATWAPFAISCFLNLLVGKLGESDES